ncbi:MAG: iron-sulfur cluster assembly scaffold protein [Woeseia sp.]
MSANPYNDAVRRHFANPLHAGDLRASYADTVSAEASGSDTGFRVVLAAELDGGILRRLRYRVFGCPHLIAATEVSCSRLEGRTAEALQEFSVAPLMELLDVPVTKAGRLLMLEDAVRALAQAIPTANRGGEPSGAAMDRRD